MAFPFESDASLRGVTLRTSTRPLVVIAVVMSLFAVVTLVPFNSAREPDLRCRRSGAAEIVCEVTTGSRLWTSTTEVRARRVSRAQLTYVKGSGNQLDLATASGPVTLVPPQGGMAGLSLDRVAADFNAFLAGPGPSFVHRRYASSSGMMGALIVAALIELSLLGLLLHRVGVQLGPGGDVVVWRRIGPLAAWRSKQVPLAELSGLEIVVERRGGALLHLKRRDGGRVTVGAPGDRDFNVPALQALLFQEPRRDGTPSPR